jgi:hypothetical protein
MSVKPEDEWKKYWQDAEKEEKLEAEGFDPVRNQFKLTEFVSNSAGRKRPRKQPRDVTLVKDLDTGRTWVLKDVPTGGLDAIAQSLLGHLQDINPFDEFVRRLRLK